MPRAVAVAVVLSATFRKELCVVERRAQRAQLVNERAEVGEAAALDPQRTVPASLGPESDLIHGAGSDPEQVARLVHDNQW